MQKTIIIILLFITKMRAQEVLLSNEIEDIKNRIDKISINLQQKENPEVYLNFLLNFTTIVLVFIAFIYLIHNLNDLQEKISKINKWKIQFFYKIKTLYRKLISLRREKIREKTRQINNEPSQDWSISGFTDKGNVRGKNEDSISTFSIGNIDFAIIADGLGGSQRGEEASRLAVNSSKKFITDTYSQCIDFWYSSHQTIALSALQFAYLKLSDLAKDLKLKANEGLRTTLSIIIATPEYYYYAYIGDGGIFCLRQNGISEQIMKPQKASDEQLNILSASLGPVIEGEPISGRVKRKKGDILIAGTDGIFDRVKIKNLAQYVFHTSIANKGNLAKTSKQIILDFAQKKNQQGDFLFDDNLTLAIIGNREKPELPKNYWKQKIQ